MFFKAVILLLLLIVLASLLTGARRGAPGGQQTASRVRPLMTKVALILLALGAAFALVHLSGCSPTNGFHNGAPARAIAVDLRLLLAGK